MAFGVSEAREGGNRVSRCLDFLFARRRSSAGPAIVARSACFAIARARKSENLDLAAVIALA